MAVPERGVGREVGLIRLWIDLRHRRPGDQEHPGTCRGDGKARAQSEEDSAPNDPLPDQPSKAKSAGDHCECVGAYHRMHGDQAGSGESGQRLAAADQCGESERRKQLPEPTIRVRIGRIPGETHRRIVRRAEVQKERTAEEADGGQEKRKDGPPRKPVCKHGEGAR